MRYFIDLSYKGTNYHGWQLQPNAISVQEKVNIAFSTVLRCEINVVGAGRTDAGVHAEQLYAYLDFETALNINQLVYKVNSILPDDIVLHKIFQVKDDAHTRFDAVSRSYEYRIFLGRNPFLLESTLQLNNKMLNVEKMNEAANILLTFNDFKCFSKSKTNVYTYNCDVKHAEWIQKEQLLVFHITADRFLRNMVRAIVGTLLEVGSGKTSIAQFKQIIESKDRCNAGTSVPAQGLFLTKVIYPKTIYINE